VFRGGRNDKHGAPFAVIAKTPTSAEDPIAILPQDLEIALPTSIELKGWAHSPNSAAPPRSRFARVPCNSADEQDPKQARKL
jgi:hypothetical protein